MSRLLEFYQNKKPANGKKDYHYIDIIKKWNDKRLEQTHDYIQWLFPDYTGGVNKRAPKLTASDIKAFKRSKTLRTKVIRAVLRMLYFYGYAIEPKNGNVKRVRDIKRKINNKLFGFYSTHSYKRITRMMIFLNQIGMEQLSSYVFLAMCHAMQEDLEFRQRVKQTGALPHWMKSQPYLREYSDSYDINEMKFNSPRSNSWDSDSDDKSEDGTSSGSETSENVERGESIHFSDEESRTSSEDDCTMCKGRENTGKPC